MRDGTTYSQQALGTAVREAVLQRRHATPRPGRSSLAPPNSTTSLAHRLGARSAEPPGEILSRQSIGRQAPAIAQPALTWGGAALVLRADTTRHAEGASGAGTAVLVVLAAALAVAIARPVLAAVAEVLQVALIMVAVVAGLGAVGLVALIAWRLRQSRANRVTAVSFATAARRIAPSAPAPGH